MRLLVKAFTSSRLSIIGGTIILSFIAMALLAPVLAPPQSENPYICPYDGPPQLTAMYSVPPTPPSSKHPFGTLNGYDLYYGCIWGARTALYISMLTTAIALAIGLTIGSIAGYFEGVIDEVLMRFTDAFFALPGLFYVILIAIAMPLNWELKWGWLNFSITLSSLDRIIVGLAVVGWPSYARLIRGEIKKVKEQDFVEAAKAVGCSKIRVLTRHILPNAIDPVVSLAFLNLGGVVVVASTISFLGFGPKQGYAEWGSILAGARSFLVFATEDAAQFALMLLIPGVFLSAFVLGWSLLGDSLLHVLDPSLRRRLNF